MTSSSPSSAPPTSSSPGDGAPEPDATADILAAASEVLTGVKPDIVATTGDASDS